MYNLYLWEDTGYLCIAEIFDGINFCQCGKGHHILSSSLRVSLVSKKGREPSFSGSMVKLMVGHTSLQWWSKGSTTSLCIMQHVSSSTFCFHNLGLEGADFLASCAAVGSLGSFAEHQWDQPHQAKGKTLGCLTEPLSLSSQW